MKLSDVKHVGLILLPLLALFGGALLLLYSSHSRSSLTVISGRAANNVRITEVMLRHELSSVVSDLQFLADNNEFITDAYCQDDANSMVTFSAMKKVYDQIRYLDITGMEVFRLDFNDGHPAVVARGKLQFKGSRYYAVEGLKLMHGEIYISPFDLNVEHGKIEQPPKPMIRFVTPVFDSTDTRLGLVVLNYLGQRLLDVFDTVPDRVSDRLMLLNKNGYWLHCNAFPELAWGFMYEDSRDRVFQGKFPDAWKAISSQGRGQFNTPDGLFTFATICPDEVIEDSVVRDPEHEAGCWKIVSMVPTDMLQAPDKAYATRLWLIGGPGALFLTALAVFVVHFRGRSRRAELSVIKQNVSFARFVPKEFLRLLGKGSLQDVELSTSVEREVAVLFSDIRSYSTLSEKLTSQEVFTLLNDYFVTVSRSITANQGFIDIFIGDALMALFPRSAEDALRAAVGMRFDLRELNERRRATGHIPVRSGFGLHFGEATLGTIGTHDRMQTTAIGDTVNLAARIESVTKTFKVEIVVSGAVYERLPDPDAFLLREIDTVRVKGKHEPVTLYECFDTDPEDLAKCKVATWPLLAQGMAHYKAGDFDKAMKAFEACAEACPADSIPPIYIKRCNTMKRIPPGKDWAGISTL